MPQTGGLRVPGSHTLVPIPGIRVPEEPGANERLAIKLAHHGCLPIIDRRSLNGSRTTDFAQSIPIQIGVPRCVPGIVQQSAHINREDLQIAILERRADKSTSSEPGMDQSLVRESVAASLQIIGRLVVTVTAQAEPDSGIARVTQQFPRLRIGD